MCTTEVFYVLPWPFHVVWRGGPHLTRLHTFALRHPLLLPSKERGWMGVTTQCWYISVHTESIYKRMRLTTGFYGIPWFDFLHVTTDTYTGLALPRSRQRTRKPSQSLPFTPFLCPAFIISYDGRYDLRDYQCTNVHVNRPKLFPPKFPFPGINTDFTITRSLSNSNSNHYLVTKRAHLLQKALKFRIWVRHRSGHTTDLVVVRQTEAGTCRCCHGKVFRLLRLLRHCYVTWEATQKMATATNREAPTRTDRESSSESTTDESDVVEKTKDGVTEGSGESKMSNTATKRAERLKRLKDLHLRRVYIIYINMLYMWQLHAYIGVTIQL